MFSVLLPCTVTPPRPQVSGNPDPRHVKFVALNQLRRCDECGAALLGLVGQRHADTNRTSCSTEGVA